MIPIREHTDLPQEGNHHPSWGSLPASTIHLYERDGLESLYPILLDDLPPPGLCSRRHDPRVHTQAV